MNQVTILYSRDLPAGASSELFIELADLQAEARAEGLYPVLVEIFPDDPETGELWSAVHGDQYPGPTMYRVFATEAEADAWLDEVAGDYDYQQH